MVGEMQVAELSALIRSVCKEEVATELALQDHGRSLTANEIASLKQTVDSLRTSLDSFYLLYAGSLVFLMQVP